MTTMISPAALRAAQTHTEAIVTINVGRIETYGLQSFLSNRIANPTIHESCYKTVPQIIIGTRYGAIAVFSLDLITNMSATHILCNAFEEWELTFNYDGAIDYWLRILLPMRR